MSWYPMDRFVPGDGDADPYGERREEDIQILGADDGYQPEPEQPHDDETCTGDEDCECPCVTCRGATEALHRL